MTTLFDQTKTLGYELDDNTLDIDVTLVKVLLDNFYHKHTICENCNTILTRNRMVTHLTKCKNDVSISNKSNKAITKNTTLVQCTICKTSLQQSKIISHLVKIHLLKNTYDVESILKSFKNGFTKHDFKLINNLLSSNNHKIIRDKLNSVFSFECDICKSRLQQSDLIHHLLNSHLNKHPNAVLTQLKSIKKFISDQDKNLISHKISLKDHEFIKDDLKDLLNISTSKQSSVSVNNSLKCKFCKKEIKEDNLITHIFLQHFESNIEFYGDYLIKFHLHDLSFNQFIKLDNLNLINTKSATLYIDSVIEKLLRIPYFCENNLEYIFIKKWLAKQKSINKNLPYIKSISNILKSKFETKIPKQEYIKQNFLTLYATWENIEFEKGYIKISPKLGVVRPIKIEGSLKILNNIKIEYFKRVHGDEVYKLVFKDGIIQNEFSSGIDKIQKLIQEEGTVATSLSNLSNKTNNYLFPSNCDKNKIQNIIIKSLSHNQYLKKCAALMNEADDVKAFIERNNDINEEALLFIYNCPDKCVMLWENLNSGRAAYVFTVPRKDKKNLYSVVKSLIEGEISNKRSLLYGNNLNFNDFKMKDLQYRCIIHDDINSYHWSLKFLLNRSI
jgi:hypothetical protein